MHYPNTTAPDLTEQDIHHFWERVNQAPGQGPAGECWQWTAALTRSGYGAVYLPRTKNRQMMAHRIAYFLHYKENPGILLVCHKCDNRACCNPAHLFLGNALVNLRDAKAKGRNAHGARQHLAKLTDEKVIEIRRLHAEEGLGQRRLGARFGVAPITIGWVLRRKTWKHI